MPLFEQCLYETLGVEQKASESDIKKAYRRQALAHHPDKNRDDAERAEEHFKQIQTAYETLIDRSKREWYDAHRESLLTLQDTSDNDQWSPSDINLETYLSPSCFRSSDFYSVYSDMFADVNGGDGGARPVFGDAESEWSEVHCFYESWCMFQSTLSFKFADKYQVTPDVPRVIRREMERLNKGLRVKARAMFNERVRAVVAIARKYDARVVRKMAEDREKEVEKEVERKKEMERKREWMKRENEAVREARQMALEEDAEGLDEILERVRIDEQMERRRRRRKKRQDKEEEEGEEEGEGVMEEELYCAACRKLLRTAGQMEDHVRSKKHKAKMKRLRREMEQEEVQFGGRTNANSSKEEEEIAAATSRRSKKKNKNKKRMEQQMHLELDEEKEEEEEGEKKLSKREKRKLREQRKKEEADAAADAAKLARKERLAAQRQAKRATPN